MSQTSGHRTGQRGSRSGGASPWATGLALFAGVMMAMFGLLGVFYAKPWARATGIGIVAVAAMGSLRSIPSYPLWSLVLLAIAIFAIRALATAE